MAMPEFFQELLKSAGDDCDGTIYYLQVLSPPQVCFPFPGEPEINVVARVVASYTLESDELNEFVGNTVALACEPGNYVPELGRLVYGLRYLDFYGEKRNTRMRSCAGVRFCVQGSVVT